MGACSACRFASAIQKCTGRRSEYFRFINCVSLRVQNKQDGGSLAQWVLHAQCRSPRIDKCLLEDCATREGPARFIRNVTMEFGKVEGTGKREPRRSETLNLSDVL